METTNQIVYDITEDSLWVNMIGRGYPAPNNAFCWCTERLKIKPTSRFITEQVDEFGEAIILIGTLESFYLSWSVCFCALLFLQM